MQAVRQNLRTVLRESSNSGSWAVDNAEQKHTIEY